MASLCKLLGESMWFLFYYNKLLCSYPQNALIMNDVKAVFADPTWHSRCYLHPQEWRIPNPKHSLHPFLSTLLHVLVLMLSSLKTTMFKVDLDTCSDWLPPLHTVYCFKFSTNDPVGLCISPSNTSSDCILCCSHFLYDSFNRCSDQKHWTTYV